MFTSAVIKHITFYIIKRKENIATYLSLWSAVLGREKSYIKNRKFVFVIVHMESGSNLKKRQIGIGRLSGSKEFR